MFLGLKKSFSLFILVAAIGLLSGCGDDINGNPFGDDLSSIDLSKAVSMSVALPTSGANQVAIDPLNTGKTSTTTQLDFPMSEIRGIQIIAIDVNGNRRRMARSTHQTAGGNDSGQAIQVISSLKSGDEIWLSDEQNRSQYVSVVTFTGDRQAHIAVDIITNGSDSVRDYYLANGNPTAITLYLHFQRDR